LNDNDIQTQQKNIVTKFDLS